MDGKVTANKWFLPLVWASDIVSRALAEGNIRPQTVRALIAELCNIREKLMGIMNHPFSPSSSQSSSAGSRCPVSLYHIISAVND